MYCVCFNIFVCVDCFFYENDAALVGYWNECDIDLECFLRAQSFSVVLTRL